MTDIKSVGPHAAPKTLKDMGDGTFAEVVSSPLASSVVGQAKIATTATAVQLASATLVNGLVIKAHPSNTAPILIGGSSVTNVYNGTGNGYPIWPGEAMSFAVPNASALYINGTAGDIAFFGGN